MHDPNPSSGAEAGADHGPSTFEAVRASRELWAHWPRSDWVIICNQQITLQINLLILTFFIFNSNLSFIVVPCVCYYMRKLFSKFMHPDESRDGWLTVIKVILDFMLGVLFSSWILRSSKMGRGEENASRYFLPSSDRTKRHYQVPICQEFYLKTSVITSWCC